MSQSSCACRYLTDYLPKLQLGALSRLVSTNDTIMALLPLLDEPPWQRRRRKQLERYIHSRWVPVESRDRLKLALPEAQVPSVGAFSNQACTRACTASGSGEAPSQLLRTSLAQAEQCSCGLTSPCQGSRDCPLSARVRQGGPKLAMQQA